MVSVEAPDTTMPAFEPLQHGAPERQGIHAGVDLETLVLDVEEKPQVGGATPASTSTGRRHSPEGVVKMRSGTPLRSATTVELSARRRVTHRIASVEQGRRPGESCHEQRGSARRRAHRAASAQLLRAGFTSSVPASPRAW